MLAVTVVGDAFVGQILHNDQTFLEMMSVLVAAAVQEWYDQTCNISRLAAPVKSVFRAK